jgi:hypothetical protein
MPSSTTRCHYLSPGLFAVSLTLLTDAVVASSEEPFGASAVNNSVSWPQETSYASSVACKGCWNDREAASDLIEKKQLYTSLDIGRTVDVENALHHPTEQGGKNIKVFALPVENGTAKKKERK